MLYINTINLFRTRYKARVIISFTAHTFEQTIICIIVYIFIRELIYEQNKPYLPGS
ncbi:hypothetical protein Emin_1061 [Elusimicrobium minutum Pei191]|uniref:Uncharacterized protein n=1 Tax=Elusimicrobium minutum (strain Pei191) TaxID=445932 RepID=B2KDL8_ELUMP|nr:hypothetical protein Emin_1061 [Elusimicrobium minutum Pei191]